MKGVKNNICWFDVPVENLDRAKRFYDAVLDTNCDLQEFDGGRIAVLPHDDDHLGGCLYESSDPAPSDQGILLYFDCNGRLDDAEALVEPNGGKIVQSKHQIGPHGFRTVVLDSEGNRIALHSV